MARPHRVVPVVLALSLYACAVACGGDDEPDAGASRGPQASATRGPTEGPTGDPTGSSAGSSTGTPAPVAGLPEGFPTEEVPLLPGVVTGKTGGAGPDGRKGWVLEMSVTGTQRSCFDEAAARLVQQGFTKQSEITAADTRQAQFTSAEYAVIVSVRADGDGLCQASYEVGQIAG